MATEQLERTEVAPSNGHRVKHAICPRCYPNCDRIPRGTLVKSWCGVVEPIGNITGQQPRNACVVCVNLTVCATCGARVLPDGTVEWIEVTTS